MFVGGMSDLKMSVRHTDFMPNIGVGRNSNKH